MKAAYQKMNEPILPPEDLKQQVLAKLDKPTGKITLRPLALVPALMLVLLLATPVMAAYVPSIQELMFQVAPNVAARFAPVQVSDTANGIRAEVVSASIHDTTIELYFSFQDLEGNRLDEDTYLGGIWLSSKSSLLRGRGGSHGSLSEPLKQDPETNIFYSMVQSSYSVPSFFGSRYLTIEEICGDKVTVNLEELNRSVDLGAVEVPITMTEPTWRTVQRTEEGSFHFETIEDLFPGGKLIDIGLGNGSDIGWFDQQSYTFLAPGEIVTEITENSAITNMCYADGELHIQVRTQRNRDAHTSIAGGHSLVDVQGNRVGSHRTFSLQYRQDEYDIDYTEFIYRIPQEELKNYTLICSLREHQTIPGPWRMTFPLVESDYADGEDGSILPTADYASSSGISQGQVHFG